MRRSAPCLCLMLFCPLVEAQVDLPPDIIVREDDLYDNLVDENDGRRFLRFGTGTANVGTGPLYLRGGEISGTTREVWQRIFRDDGSWYERLAGHFIYHPEHDHVHIENWTVYRVREVVGDDGVGAVLAEGPKTSFCIIDFGVYDDTLPGFDPNPQFTSCGGDVQGLSIGWIDIYDINTPGQLVEITGIPDGVYWLEVEADPDDQLLELDETNNIARIMVTIGDVPFAPDAYEENDSFDEVDARQEGKPNSPNLGPVGPTTLITGLTVDASNDDDYYRFYMPAMGDNDSRVRIEFDHFEGDLDLDIYDADRNLVGQSNGTINHEQVFLRNFDPGWYYARVYGFDRARSPDYSLQISVSANQTPTIETLTPPAGDTHLHHGEDTYEVTWNWSDPEANEAWVTIFVNAQPVLDGNEIPMASSLNTPAALGSHMLNTAIIEPGTWWVYCQITDGGSFAGDWSEGTITLEEHGCPADLTGSGDPNDPGYGIPDGSVDGDDFFFYLDLFASGDPGADLTGSGDPNDPFYGIPDGSIDADDFFFYLDLFVQGCS